MKRLARMGLAAAVLTGGICAWAGPASAIDLCSIQDCTGGGGGAQTYPTSAGVATATFRSANPKLNVVTESLLTHTQPGDPYRTPGFGVLTAVPPNPV